MFETMKRMFAQQKAYPEITPAEIDARPRRRIDVRSEFEFHGELGHLDGAELVPLGQLAQAAGEWDRTEPLLMICRSGNRSGQACQLLVQMGFEDVTNLRGGMLAVPPRQRKAS